MSLKTNPETTREWQRRSQQKAREKQLSRTPIERAPLKRGAKLRPVSSMRQKQNREYGEARKKHLKRFPLCVRCESVGRQIVATDIHHKAGREGARLVECSAFVGLCRACHDWVHGNPIAARESGFLGSKFTAVEEL